MVNSLLFSNTILWDGTNQFNELPIFSSDITEDDRREQRGAFFVDNHYGRVLRLLATLEEENLRGNSTCRVCYRLSSIQEKMRIGSANRIYYPFTIPLDFSVSDLRLGVRTPFLSFSDNTEKDNEVNLSKLMALIGHLVASKFIVVDDENLFSDLLTSQLSTPPMASDPHFNLIYGVAPPGDQECLSDDY